ncbi:SixA phosphatase family protein [Mariprofundus ferrooxydans]|uniref:SixA phosphatase family protein n=1 Tax=Mariprofundus ferrooxydans TaxID=314344 RepID=UPI000377BF06|nr:histidine phosphatase family protein [Mariprofundus ferrooxydans]
MKRMILLRHAKSSWAQPALNDFERPLNKRGKRDAPIMGMRLKRQKKLPDKIVSSPAKRAISTAGIIAKQLDIPKSAIRKEPGIYDASAIELLAIIRNWQNAWETVLMVGHMPGIADLAWLLVENEVGPVPTCSVLEIELEINHWSDARPGCGRLACVMTPKESAG